MADNARRRRSPVERDIDALRENGVPTGFIAEMLEEAETYLAFWAAFRMYEEEEMKADRHHSG